MCSLASIQFHCLILYRFSTVIKGTPIVVQQPGCFQVRALFQRAAASGLNRIVEVGLARQKALLRLLNSTNWAPKYFLSHSKKCLGVHSWHQITFPWAVSPRSVPLAPGSPTPQDLFSHFTFTQSYNQCKILRTEQRWVAVIGKSWKIQVGDR